MCAVTMREMPNSIYMSAICMQLLIKRLLTDSRVATPNPVDAITCSLSPPAEIIMHEGVTAVYKSNVDLFFYVLGAQTENEVEWVWSMYLTMVTNDIHTHTHPS